jgi:hypothetical protein
LESRDDIVLTLDYIARNLLIEPLVEILEHLIHRVVVGQGHQRDTSDHNLEALDKRLKALRK